LVLGRGIIDAEASMKNLNDLSPDVDGYSDSEALFREQTSVTDASVRVFFDHMPHYLGEIIAQTHFVAGCMAWLTNRMVLERLAALSGGCQIVVQKEDFLRPDNVTRGELKALYGALRSPDRHALPTRTSVGSSVLSYAASPECDAVRCMGMRPVPGRTTPKMHHKFFVFFDAEMTPRSVWTGSFNATHNGANSRENAVHIVSDKVAAAYALEWSRTLALSEPLDWSSEYVEPEWRFGS
jgi:hypothetical protein